MLSPFVHFVSEDQQRIIQWIYQGPRFTFFRCLATEFGGGRKPDHILDTDPQTGLPRAVVEAKAHAEYYLSTQLKDYLDLVGPTGYVILAVPKSGAKIAQTLYDHPRIHVAYVLPPK